MAMEYITLVASLPHLPYFERAERVPITERALNQRLSMLSAEHASDLRLAMDLLRYRRNINTDEIQTRYRKAMDKISHPVLRQYVDWSIGWRTGIAALRLKTAGQATPPKHRWGAGHLTNCAERNWEKDDAGLTAVFPWLKEACELLLRKDSVGLMRSQFKAEWRRLSQMADDDPFGFANLSAYVFKWNILSSWLSYEATEAKRRFQFLVKEVIGERALVCH